MECWHFISQDSTTCRSLKGKAEICSQIHIPTELHYKYSPIVGIVVTISPSLSLYKMVVLPAASRPTIKILISFLAKSRLNNFVNVNPILPGSRSLNIINTVNQLIEPLTHQNKSQTTWINYVPDINIHKNIKHNSTCLPGHINPFK